MKQKNRDYLEGQNTLEQEYNQKKQQLEQEQQQKKIQLQNSYQEKQKKHGKRTGRCDIKCF